MRLLEVVVNKSGLAIRNDAILLSSQLVADIVAGELRLLRLHGCGVKFTDHVGRAKTISQATLRGWRRAATIARSDNQAIFLLTI